MEMAQTYFSQMDRIIEGMYLGNIQAASNLQLLKAKGVTHILQVAAGFKPFFPGEFTYMVINVLDMPFENLGRHFKPALDFIKGALRNGTVLVHCYAGISRSASVVIAYLMKELGLPMLDALTFVRKRRPIVYPNPGFQRQLFEYEKHLRANNEKTMKEYQDKKRKRIIEQQKFAKEDQERSERKKKALESFDLGATLHRSSAERHSSEYRRHQQLEFESIKQKKHPSLLVPSPGNNQNKYVSHSSTSKQGSKIFQNNFHATAQDGSKEQNAHQSTSQSTRAQTSHLGSRKNFDSKPPIPAAQTPQVQCTSKQNTSQNQMNSILIRNFETDHQPSSSFKVKKTTTTTSEGDNQRLLTGELVDKIKSMNMTGSIKFNGGGPFSNVMQTSYTRDFSLKPLENAKMLNLKQIGSNNTPNNHRNHQDKHTNEQRSTTLIQYNDVSGTPKQRTASYFYQLQHPQNQRSEQQQHPHHHQTNVPKATRQDEKPPLPQSNNRGSNTALVLNSPAAASHGQKEHRPIFQDSPQPAKIFGGSLKQSQTPQHQYGKDEHIKTHSNGHGGGLINQAYYSPPVSQFNEQYHRGAGNLKEMTLRSTPQKSKLVLEKQKSFDHRRREK